MNIQNRKLKVDLERKLRALANQVYLANGAPQVRAIQEKLTELNAKLSELYYSLQKEPPANY